MDSHGHTHSHEPTAPAQDSTGGNGHGSATARNLIIGGIVAIALSYLLGIDAKDNMSHFLHSYVVSYAFFLSLSLGALFFIAIQHATGAEWSVTVRRLAEIMTGAFPVLALLFLPVLFSVYSADGALFPWAVKNAAAIPAVTPKIGYLNPTFFTVRWVAYFVTWILLSRSFFKRSVLQDTTGDPALTLTSESMAPITILLFGGTLTFAAFDLLMSLDPQFFSTIFGVYYFAGSWMAFYAAISLGAMFLQKTGRIGDEITTEHYHDLGKFLFGFVFFWGYIAFDQYMLIWYANMPVETHWFLLRQQGGWAALSWGGLLIGHFAFPFMGLMSRHVKRSRPALAFFCAWLLAMHYLDLYWIVMPTVDKGQATFAIVDVAIFAAIGCVVAAAIVRTASGVSLVARRDPRLAASLVFENF